MLRPSHNALLVASMAGILSTTAACGDSNNLDTSSQGGHGGMIAEGGGGQGGAGAEGGSTPECQPEQCPQPTAECMEAACVDDMCSEVVAAVGTACTGGAATIDAACDSQAQCVPLGLQAEITGVINGDGPVIFNGAVPYEYNGAQQVIVVGSLGPGTQVHFGDGTTLNNQSPGTSGFLFAYNLESKSIVWTSVLYAVSDTSSSFVNSVAVLPNGDIVAAGGFAGSVFLPIPPSLQMVSATTYTDYLGFIMSPGNATDAPMISQYVAPASSTSFDGFNSVTIGSDGKPVFGGQFIGDIQPIYNGNPLNGSSNNASGLLGRWNMNGVPGNNVNGPGAWSYIHVLASPTSYSYPNQLISQPDGSIIALGTYDTTVSINGAPTDLNDSGRNTYMIRFDSSYAFVDSSSITGFSGPYSNMNCTNAAEGKLYCGFLKSDNNNGNPINLGPNCPGSADTGGTVLQFDATTLECEGLLFTGGDDVVVSSNAAYGLSVNAFDVSSDTTVNFVVPTVNGLYELGTVLISGNGDQKVSVATMTSNGQAVLAGTTFRDVDDPVVPALIIAGEPVEASSSSNGVFIVSSLPVTQQ